MQGAARTASRGTWSFETGSEILGSLIDFTPLRWDGSPAGEPCWAERPGAGRLVVPWAVAPVIDGEPRWAGSVPAWAVFVCGGGALFGCRGASVANFLALV